MPQAGEMQFSSQVFGGVYCSSFNCRNIAKYAIGRCIGPASLKTNICEQCARDLVQNIPPELLEFKPEPLVFSSDPILLDPEVTPEELVQYARNFGTGLGVTPAGAGSGGAVNPTPSVFTCEKCGAVFLNYMGKQTHQKHCKGGGI